MVFLRHVSVSSLTNPRSAFLRPAFLVSSRDRLSLGLVHTGSGYHFITLWKKQYGATQDAHSFDCTFFSPDTVDSFQPQDERWKLNVHLSLPPLSSTGGLMDPSPKVSNAISLG